MQENNTVKGGHDPYTERVPTSDHNFRGRAVLADRLGRWTLGSLAATPPTRGKDYDHVLFYCFLLQWADTLPKKPYEISNTVLTVSEVNSTHRNKQDGLIHEQLSMLKSSRTHKEQPQIISNTDANKS
jgi:hypothetical protein